MKNYCCFNYDFLFGDHFAKLSNQAKLYYVKLNFHANNGFVPNPKSVLDSLGYDIGVFNELVSNGELLVLPDRCEVFIAAYFIHNKGFNCYSWRSTPYAVYWENKLYVKKNGIVHFDPGGLKKDEKDPLDKITTPSDDEDNQDEEDGESDNQADWENNLAETIRIAKTPWLDGDDDSDTTDYLKGNN